eukprot:6029820-Lingulodinium_polyedra.AAC.1
MPGGRAGRRDANDDAVQGTVDRAQRRGSAGQSAVAARGAGPAVRDGQSESHSTVEVHGHGARRAGHQGSHAVSFAGCLEAPPSGCATSSAQCRRGAGCSVGGDERAAAWVPGS